MRTEVLLLLLFLIVIAGLYVVSLALEKPKIIAQQGEVYLGPVRPTDNESHFRATGRTIPLT